MWRMHLQEDSQSAVNLNAREVEGRYEMTEDGGVHLTAVGEEVP